MLGLCIELQGIPVLISPVFDDHNPTLASCNLIVEISSRHACPSLTPSSPASETVCYIKDPFDGFEIDLSSFASSDVTVLGGSYMIGVCGPIKKSGCNSGQSHLPPCTLTLTKVPMLTFEQSDDNKLKP